MESRQLPEVPSFAPELDNWRYVPDPARLTIFFTTKLS
jgi:hypothetical protein